MRTHAKNSIVLSLLLLLGLTAFQNCVLTDGRLSSKITTNKPANNGEGYTGKAYINIAKDGSCGTQTTKSAIEKIGSEYIQTVKDCQTIAPLNVTAEVEAMEYNGGAVFIGATVFERLATGQASYSEVICRGLATTLVNGQRAFADVSMQPTAKFETDGGGIQHQVYEGYVKVGTYDVDGKLTSTKQFPVKRALEHNLPTVRIFAIDPPPGAGPPPLPANPPDPSSPPLPERYALIIHPTHADFLFKVDFQSDGFVVPNMKCHSH